MDIYRDEEAGIRNHLGIDLIILSICSMVVSAPEASNRSWAQNNNNI